MPKAFTNEYFYQQMKELHPDINITGKYVNTNTKMHCIHLCGYEWDTIALVLLHGHGCPKCNHAIPLSQNEFEDKVYQNNTNIKIVGKYKNQNTKIKVKCLIDGYEWDAHPTNLQRGHGCPVCDNKIVVQGINDISTTHPNLVQYFNNPEEALKYSWGSHKHIIGICPSCGATRDIEIKSLATQGFSCYICGDGISIPNKIACSVLSQLPIKNWKREYSPKWANRKIYDNYFEYNNKKYILEMDGGFHYKNNKMSGQTVNDYQEIDRFKDKLAEEHNIIVIRIECKDSSLEYIKNNLLKSVLSDIFDLNTINWDQCYEFINSSFIRKVCEYYQENRYTMTKANIAKHFHISCSTLNRYREIGVSRGWCDVTTDNEKKEIFANVLVNPKSKAVIVFDNNQIIGTYKSLNACAKELSKKYNRKFYGSSISDSIKKRNGKLGSLYFKYVA